MGKMMPHHAAKRDGNEQTIVRTLEGIGAQVYRLSQKGLPDLLVCFNGRTILVEVKSKGGALTPAQYDTLQAWQGAPIEIVWTVNEALMVLGAEVTA